MRGTGLEYIRSYYRVPADVGGSVWVRNTGKSGTITGTEQAWLTVSVDGRVGNYHPYDLDYLVDGVWVASEPIRAAHDEAWDRFNQSFADSAPR